MSDLMKRCPKCTFMRNRANFSSNGYCKQCDKIYHAEKRAQQPRKCRQCKEAKMPDQYNEAASRSCTECVNATKERKKSYVPPMNFAGDEPCPLMSRFLRSKFV
jgi:hypothetical protein